MLGNSYAGGMTTRQHHPKLKIGSKPKPKPKGKRLAFLPSGAQNGTQSYLPLTTINVRAIARWMPDSDPVTLLISLVQGGRLQVNYEGKPTLIWLQ